MTKKSNTYVKYKNRYYPYYLESLDSEGSIDITIPELDFKAGYILEDLPEFLEDFENILETHMQLNAEENKQKTICRFRISITEKEIIEKKANDKGFKNTSEFLRHVALNN